MEKSCSGDEKMNSENFVTFVKYFRAFDFMKENHPEYTLSIYGDGSFTNTDPKAVLFRENIAKGIAHSKVFEIDDDIKKLLCLTDTPLKNDEIKLPFPIMFLDVKFTKEELAEYGIEIKAKKVIGVIIQEGKLISNNDEVVGKDLNLTMLSFQENDEAWFDTFNKNANLEDAYQLFNVKIMENETTDKKARDFVHKFFLNFLNFINNPEVEMVEHSRSIKNIQRKMKKGKTIIPSSFVVRISGRLKEYIDEIRAGTHWHYGYRFWVRGHFRDLVSARYTEKKRIWILPYIKGKGVLIDKSYQVKTRSSNDNKSI